MVFPATEKIIFQAALKYETFNNYYEHLEKRVDALVKRRIEEFGETQEAIKEVKKEISAEAKRTYENRAKLLLLEKRKESVIISSNSKISKLIEAMDDAEISRLKKLLKPSQDKINGLCEKIHLLNYAHEKEKLLEDLETCQDLWEQVALTLYKAEIYETAQEVETKVLKEEFNKMSKEQQKRLCIPSPKYAKEWNSLSWKELAEQKFADLQKIYEKEKRRQRT